MSKCAIVVPVVVFLFIVTHGVVAHGEDLDTLEGGIKQRLRTYSGLEFSLESSFYQESSQGKKIDDVEVSRETVRLHFPDKGPAWKYWVQEIPDQFDGQWIAKRFMVTNVKETRVFTYTPEGEGKWSNGSIFPWHLWNDQEGRSFFSLLSVDTVGLSLFSFNVSKEMRDKLIDNAKIAYVSEGKCDGMRTLIFKGSNKEFGVTYEIHITSPYSLVVCYDIRTEELGGSFSYNVEKIGIFEGICYPKKGGFHQTAIQNIDKIDYAFEVVDIKRFDTGLLKNWFPDWSPSTIVVDVAHDKTTRILPSERQMKKVAEQWSSYEIEPRPVTWVIFSIVLMVIGAVITLTALYLLWKRRK